MKIGNFTVDDEYFDYTDDTEELMRIEGIDSPIYDFKEHYDVAAYDDNTILLTCTNDDAQHDFVFGVNTGKKLIDAINKAIKAIEEHASTDNNHQ